MRPARRPCSRPDTVVHTSAGRPQMSVERQEQTFTMRREADLRVTALRCSPQLLR